MMWGIGRSKMRTKVVSRGILIVMVIAGGWRGEGQTAGPKASPYDRPLRTVRVDLGPSEFYESARNMHSYLTCNYYPGFMVKDLDLREKGEEWIGIVPLRQGRTPKCVREQEKEEIRPDNREWEGYFVGVVGTLIFSDNSDGQNGSMGFCIIEAATGRKIFYDQAKRSYRLKNGNLVWEGERLRIERRPEGAPVLTYTRGYFAECSLQKDGPACWNKIRASTGLPAMAAPACTGEFKDDPGDPSVVFFPVRVELGQKLVAVPVPGPVRW
jgi:hypothetical protein